LIAIKDLIAMTAYETILEKLKTEEHIWLITGVAGFIGSNLLEALLKHNQRVVGLDNFATGFQHNLDEVRALVGEEQWNKFRFIEGDIRKLDDCLKACEGVEFVLHEAALGSVPRSIADPIATNEVNISGFLNMLVAARDCKVRRMVYAASSSTYGDHPDLPKIEDRIGKPLSPYAVTKYVNELYADVFTKTYNMELIGLRYFNVFGPRQNPNGAYAAVIPKWISSMMANKEIYINGDGETSRDFCFIANAVQANILATLSKNPGVINEVFNVAFGEKNSLNELFKILKLAFKNNLIIYSKPPLYLEFRVGDIKHSLADIGKAKSIINYRPLQNLELGIIITVKKYLYHLK
jgi:UDP-N-acetylglucosamine 4-epimerase